MIVVTLIHGTWARKSTWTHPDSRLSRALQRNLTSEGEDVRLFRFEWTGRNRARARATAAVALRRELRARVAEFPNAEHFIIAHSHGGNVAWQAIADDSHLVVTVSLICASTPFLSARPRAVSGDALITLCVAAPISVTAFAALLHLGWHPFPLWLISSALTMGAAGYVWNRRVTAARTYSELLRAPRGRAARLLIIRPENDEASTGLLTSEGVIRVFDTTWDWTTGESLADCTQKKTLPQRGGRAVLRMARVAAFLPILAVVGVFAALATLAVGFDLLFAWPFVRVSVDHTPAGRWLVCQIPNPVHQSPVASVNEFYRAHGMPALLHSMPYDDPRAIAEIMRWIRSRGRPTVEDIVHQSAWV